MATFLQEWKTYFLSSGTSTPYPRDKRGMIRVYLDSQSTANNTSTISINHYVQMYNNTWDLGSAGVPNNTSSYRCNNGSFGGTYQTKSIGTQYSSPYSNYTNKLIGTTTHTVTHNADGTCQLYVNGSYSDDEQTKTSSFNIALPQIPRATTITSFNWYKDANATGLSKLWIYWAAANNCDDMQYSLNGGSWTSTSQSGTSGYYGIGSLTPNTQYSMKIRVKRADTQIWTESSTLNATTYDIAKITNANVDFNVDNGITVYFNNPSGSKTDVWIEGINQIGGTAQYAIPIRENVSSPFVYTLTQAEKNILFNNNSTRDKFPIRIVVRTNDNYLGWKDGTASITNANPTFTTWTYADTNATTTALTGNNQTIIKGYSNVKATITSANKMVAIKGATGTSYQLTIGEKKATANYSPSSTVEMTINAVDNNVFNCYAIDSRNNSTPVSKTLTTDYINYTPISITSATATRTDDIGTETTLAFSGNIFDGSFGSVTNTIKSATYKFKKTTDANYTNGTSVITPTKTGGTFSFSGTIKGDEGAGGVNGFDATYSYNIQVIVTDELSTHTFNFILGSGKPHIAMHRDGIAINQPYDETLGGALQVNGAVDIKDSSAVAELKRNGNTFIRNTAYGTTIISSTGTSDNTIYFRPNGMTNATNQLILGATSASIGSYEIKTANTTKRVTLYTGPSSGGVLHTTVNITLSETLANYQMLLVVIGTSANEVVTVPLSTGYVAGTFDCRALSSYYAIGEISSSGATNLGFKVREVGGWSASAIKINYVFGIKL